MRDRTELLPAAEETLVALVKGILSIIPGGGIVSELANVYVNPVERRKQQWSAGMPSPPARRQSPLPTSKARIAPGWEKSS
jgi:hypothetical protein